MWPIKKEQTILKN